MLGWKLLLAVIATLIGLAAFAPYFLDILKRRTQPHAYTWLIWSITQGTAVAALLKGNGGFGAMNLTVGTSLVFIIFILSFWYGTKNITKSDTAVFILALLGIIVWWLLHQPLVTVIMVSLIDLLGYIPTWRKTFDEPWSETLWSWVAFALSNIFALLALKDFNLLTATYLVSITVANIIVAVILLVRRSILPVTRRDEQL